MVELERLQVPAQVVFDVIQMLKDPRTLPEFGLNDAVKKLRQFYPEAYSKNQDHPPKLESTDPKYNNEIGEKLFISAIVSRPDDISQLLYEMLLYKDQHPEKEKFSDICTNALSEMNSSNL